MSKQKAKKPVLSEEERRARMAALTSDVAAVNLLDGGTVRAAPLPDAQPAPVATPAAARADAAPAAAVAPVTTSPAAVAPAAVAQSDAPAPAAVPAAAPAGKESASENSVAPVGQTLPTPALSSIAAPAPNSLAPDSDLSPEQPAAGRVGEPAGEAASPIVPAGELDLTSLFTPSAEKKTTTLRITAGHQQFFNQLGLVLGNGASAPDIIHNILTQFRQQHEAALGKQVKKALARQFR